MFLIDDKPPLDEDLLMHFGIPGMKWGHRKARESGGSGSSGSGGSSAPKRQLSTKQKHILLGVGTGLAIGGATAAFILAKRGGVKVPSITKAAKTAYQVEKAVAPSPFAMRMEAGRAAHRNLLTQQMNRAITDKTWRDAAKMSQTIRENSRLSSALESNLLARNDAILRSLRR